MNATAVALGTIIVGMGAVTYAIRLSLIVLLGRIRVPPLVQRALRFVPPAVLSALILPELLLPGGTLVLSLGNPRLLAGVLAGLVAWRSKNVILAIAVGMVALWSLQALLPR
jgi:branched-subunit amino acid transport protein